MSIQPPTKLSYQRALSCALANQLATPGLGSLLGGRYLAGAGQLLLAVTGFVLVVVWVMLTLRESYRLAFSGIPPKSYAWLGATGALIFAASWFWALVTSILLLRQAKSEEQANRTTAPPAGANPPPRMQ